jgi:RNA polymerase sigma-70 factor (sigma-E family)
MGTRRSAERDEAFVAFMQAAQPGLLRAAFFLTGSHEAAHDLTQDALVRTYLAWPRVRPDGAYAYARRVLVNQRTERWRRNAREIPTDFPVDHAARGDQRPDDRDELVRLLASLPEQQRKVVVLRYYADLSEREVADLLGISVGTVKSTASRGLSALRDLAINFERSPS